MAHDPTPAADPQSGRIRTVTWDDPAVYQTQTGLSGYELLDSISQGTLYAHSTTTWMILRPEGGKERR
jgi:hypothetical protein